MLPHTIFSIVASNVQAIGLHDNYSIMKYIYVSILLSLLGVIILLSNDTTIEYQNIEVEVVKSDGSIIAERVEAIMNSSQFIEEMKHIAIARAMLELSKEYLEQAEVLQHAGQENMQRSLAVSQEYYDGNF